MVYTVLVIVQVVVALTLVGLILVQHGKGADAGAAFGSGASGTVFGAQGAANFMTRATAGLATVFFLISLTLAYLINGASTPTGSVTDQVQQPTPNTSVLSDSNNNSVAGDEAATGDSGKDSAARNEQASAGVANSNADQDNNNASAGGNKAGQQQINQQQSNGNAGHDAGDADTGAQIPD